MERREFVARGTAIVVGAGLASGVASGIAEMTTPALRAAAGGKDQRVTVLKGRVVSVRRPTGTDLAVGHVRVRLDAEAQEEPVEVRFVNRQGSTSTYLGPNFDLDRVQSSIRRGDELEVVVHGRDGTYDALKVL